MKQALADNVRGWLAANQTFPDSSPPPSATAQAPKASRCAVCPDAACSHLHLAKPLPEFCGGKESFVVSSSCFDCKSQPDMF